MDYQEVYVSRQLIKYHFQHPEPYGESMVELINGMVTDVFTHDEGYLYTPTNDQALIDYLKRHQKPDVLINQRFDAFSIRTLNKEDKPLIKQWLFKGEDIGEEAINLYLSHGFSSRSHIFMLEKEGSPIGIFGFNIFNTDFVFNLHMDDESYIAKIIDTIIPFLKTKHTFKKLSTTIHEDEKTYQESLEALGFTLNNVQTNNINQNSQEACKKLVYEKAR